MRPPDLAPELKVQDLARRLEAGEALQVVDVRAPQRVATDRIDSAERFWNLPNSVLQTLADPATTGLSRELPVAVVCDRGFASQMGAELLRRAGFDAVSVGDGMLGWSLVALPRELADPAPFDRIVQLDRLAKGALSYLLLSAGEAFVIDPSRDIAPYLELIAEAGARLVGVADTHAHADYLSGGPALAHRAGVPYLLHPADAVSPYDGRAARLRFEPLADGQTIPVGRAQLTVRSTPGHTEGSVTFVADRQLAFTGDFVFVASVGRPDLGNRVEAWTGVLWNSLEAARRDWPAALRVLPAHYSADSERGIDRVVVGAWGDLQSANEGLAIHNPAEFTRWIAARCGSFPETYRQIKTANLGLSYIDPDLAAELEVGKNQCAVSG